MNLDQLYHIIETTKSKSISKAAATLHISQSGLSQSISSLEKELGLSLFNRTQNGVYPTKEASAIIKKAMDVVAIVEEIQLEAVKHVQLLDSKLLLAGIPGTMDSFVKTVVYLKRKYPNSMIEIEEKGALEIIKDIEEGRIDAAFVPMNEALLNSHVALYFQPVLKGKMVVCVGKNSSLADKQTISPKELKGQRFVLYDDDYVRWFIQDFNLKFGEVDVLFTTNNSNVISQTLMEGMAVTVVHDYSFYHRSLAQSDKIVMLELEQFPQQSVEYGWLMGKKKKNTLLNEFIEYFKEDQKSYINPQ